MFSFFNKKEDLVNLPSPKNQEQEALFLLIKEPSGLNRMDFMRKAVIFNSPEIIRRLRYYGVEIESKKKPFINKFGRESEYVVYSLVDLSMAKKQYHGLFNGRK